ncbi:hypothetical protein DINM_004193 [Dirofilaria immitis]|nr:hypothetical protein [Dirofilaria immitis]
MERPLLTTIYRFSFDPSQETSSDILKEKFVRKTLKDGSLMSNWPLSATTYSKIFDECHFSPMFHSISTVKQEFRNQVSISSPSTIFTNNAEYFTANRLVPYLNMYFQNELDRTSTDNQSSSLLNASITEELCPTCNPSTFKETLIGMTRQARY